MEEWDRLESLSILAPNSIDLRHIPGGFSRLTQHDIAAKLAKCPEAAACYGRVKIAGQENLIPKLEKYIKRFVSVPDNMRDLLIRQAILEVLDPKICRTCKGRGWMPIKSRIVACEDCYGGKYRYSEESRARNCKVSRRQWRQTWEAYFIPVLTIAWSLEADLRDNFT